MFINKSIKSPKLVIDIRLHDDISSSNRQFRQVTPIGSHPVQILRYGNTKSHRRVVSDVKRNKPMPAYQGSSNIFNLKNVSHISTSPSNMLSTQFPKETDPTPVERNIKKFIMKHKTFIGKSNTPYKRLKTRRQSQKQYRANKMDSNEIGIFNIDEEHIHDSLSQSGKKYPMFNSPTPEASESKLDIEFDNYEIKSQEEKQSMINIDLKEQPRNPKINRVSNMNNSQTSNKEIQKFPPRKTKHASTSPSIPLESKQFKYYKEIGIGTKESYEPQPGNFELKKSKLYTLFVENYDNYTELSEHVSYDFKLDNFSFRTSNFEFIYRCIIVTQNKIS
jgi:hypothetical protein